MPNGVILMTGIFGFPLMKFLGSKSWALMVVPCGIDPMRQIVATPDVLGDFDAGTRINNPCSKWISTFFRGSAVPVVSLSRSDTVC